MTSKRKVDLEDELIAISAQLDFLAEAIFSWNNDFPINTKAREGLEAILSSLAEQVLALSEVASKTGGPANE